MIITLILSLFLLGIVNAPSAYTFLYISGALLIAGEVVTGSFGLLALNGLIAFFVGYAIQTGDNTLFGIHVDWSTLYGIAFVEALVLIVCGVLIMRYRRLKSTTGAEAMIGQKAVVINWKGTSGTVLIEGENWKAKSDKAMDLAKNAEVTVKAVEGLTLKIDV